MGAVAGTRGDGEDRTATTGTVSVAELYRRLGPAPVPADTAGTGVAPLLVGDLLRRERHPAVVLLALDPAGEEEPGPPAAIPVPRRRTAEACRTALGAGGLVVAGSVLGAALLAAAGVPFPEVKKDIDASIRELDKIDPTVKGIGDVAQSRILIPYFAWIIGRDSSYRGIIHKWYGPTVPAMTPTSMQALAALDQGDTAQARKLAAQFARGDTAKQRAQGPAGLLGPFVEAEVLAALGDTKGAVATYESINPAQFAVFGFGDVRWPLYARSFLARGQLYEQLGDRAKARELYELAAEMLERNPNRYLARAYAGLAEIEEAEGNAREAAALRAKAAG
jgi:hypothetical protein